MLTKRLPERGLTGMISLDPRSMWNTLSHSDLEAARRHLRSQREEMMRRHAEELAALDRDDLEIERLDQLIDAFLQKLINANEPLVLEPGVQENSDVHTRANVTAGVSLFITQAQKSKLRQLGLAEEQIRVMKPSEAHRILGLAS